MKVTSSDLLAILRRFKLADTSNVPRHIEQIKTSNPNATNFLVSFRFNRGFFYVLFDDTAEDDEDYIMQQIYTVKSDAVGVILENPVSELTTYGLPFKGKDCYLFQLVSSKKRLDVLLAERHPDISRSTWQKYVRAGYVAVNNQPVTSPKQDVTEADSIAINLPPASDFSDQEIPVLYIDDNVIVIDKPAGILTHSKGAMNDEFTAADFFRRYTTVGLDTSRPGIVHRLDRDTSGVMIGARNENSFALLKRQFSDRKAQKTYLAIIKGMLKQPVATIDIPVARNPNEPSSFRVDPKGKAALTDYRVLAEREGYSLVELKPHTGRTHQIRVHLAHLGVPILGDRLYGKAADRMYLHAYKLELTTAPEQRQTFTVAMPSEYLKYFPDGNSLI